MTTGSLHTWALLMGATVKGCDCEQCQMVATSNAQRSAIIRQSMEAVAAQIDKEFMDGKGPLASTDVPIGITNGKP